MVQANIKEFCSRYITEQEILFCRICEDLMEFSYLTIFLTVANTSFMLTYGKSACISVSHGHINNNFKVFC